MPLAWFPGREVQLLTDSGPVGWIVGCRGDEAPERGVQKVDRDGRGTNDNVQRPGLALIAVSDERDVRAAVQCSAATKRLT